MYRIGTSNISGFDITNLSYTSNSFDFLIQKATELINLNYAYVDDSTHEEKN
jgi:hypothetical protein